MTENSWSVRTLISALVRRGEAASIIAFTPTGSVTCSANTLAGNVRALAAGLRSIGAKPGDPIAVWGPNTPEWITAALSVMAIGGVLVPVDDGFGEEEADRLLTAASVKIVLASAEHVDLIGNTPKTQVQKTISFSSEEWEDLLKHTKAELPILENGQPAALLATSGTTGAPKLFHLTHGNVAANIEALAGANIAGPEDRALLPLPLHHAYPLMVGMLAPLTVGTAIILPERITGPHVLAALADGAATVMIGVPRLYEALLAGLNARVDALSHPARWLFRKLLALSDAVRKRWHLNIGRPLFAPVRKGFGPRLRVMISGGAHLPIDLQHNLESLGWVVLPGYGLAETASVFTAMLMEQYRTGSVGRAVNGGEVRIDSADEEGVGEILLRGPNVTSAYLNNDEANQTSFTSDGWFRTGDLGRLDEDGFLFITGRRKEMITLGGGKKVNPEDLEKAYRACEVIEEIAILEADGSLVALVRPKTAALKTIGVVNPTHAIDIGLTEVMQRLATYERLTGFAIAREPLPRTRLGKLRRFMLPELFETAKNDVPPVAGAEDSTAPEAVAEDAIGQAVINHLKRRFPDKTIRMESNPSLDLGLDSLGWMGLALELEEHLGHSLVEAELSEAANVSDLIERVREAEAAGPALTKTLDLGDPKDWLRPRGAFLLTAGTILFALNRLVMRLYFGLTIEGREHLPDHGPYLIAPNHVSDLDPLVVAASLPYATIRQVYWAGDKNRLFYNRLTRLFCRMVHLFPVDEFKPDQAIDTAATVLSRDGIQVWFPEGWRSPDGSVLEFRPGVGILLQRSGVKVIPTYIDGAFEALPRNRRIPKRAKIQVRFGAPMDTDVLQAQGDGETSDIRIASALRASVIALIPTKPG